MTGSMDSSPIYSPPVVYSSQRFDTKTKQQAEEEETSLGCQIFACFLASVYLPQTPSVICSARLRVQTFKSLFSFLLFEFMAGVIQFSSTSLNFYLNLLAPSSSSSFSSCPASFLASSSPCLKPLKRVSFGGVPLFPWRPQEPGFSFKVKAAVTETEQPKWWERTAGPNMIDIHSTQEFLNVLSQAGDKLVIVEFYGTWCASCRALFPKLCKTAEEHPDILFLKVNFDENKAMCKRMNVKVLPYFHFYRGADGQLEAFSCSLAKFQKIKDAIEMHNSDRFSLGPPKGVGDVLLEPSASSNDKPSP